MDIRKALQKEWSKKQCNLIVDHIGDHADRFRQLMDIFFGGIYRDTQRAARPMSLCAENHPELIRPYLKPLIDGLSNKHLHDAIIRNTLRLLQYVDVPKRYHGKLMNACFALVQSPNAAVAIKAFALTVLGNLSKVYPEILPELKVIIDERIDNERPAFRQRAKRIK